MKANAQAGARFVSAPDARAGAALIYGPNRSRVAEACAAISAKLLDGNSDPFAFTRLSEDELKRDKARLNDALAAQSFFSSGLQVVRVRADGDAAADAILDALKRIEAGDANAFLLIEGGDLAKKSKLRAGFEAAGKALAIAFYEESAEDLQRLAQSELSAAGVALEPAAWDVFAAALPTDRAAVRGEIEKLSLYAHGLSRALSVSEVRALSIAGAESEIDDAALAALSGDGAGALLALERADGGGGVMAARTLGRKLMRLAEAHALMAGGVSASEVADKLRPPVFFGEKPAFQKQLRLWGPEKLARGIELAFAAEAACKSAGAPVAVIIARLARDLAALAGR